MGGFTLSCFQMGTCANCKSTVPFNSDICVVCETPLSPEYQHRVNVQNQVCHTRPTRVLHLDRCFLVTVDENLVSALQSNQSRTFTDMHHLRKSIDALHLTGQLIFVWSITDLACHRTSSKYKQPCRFPWPRKPQAPWSPVRNASVWTMLMRGIVTGVEHNPRKPRCPSSVRSVGQKMIRTPSFARPVAVWLNHRYEWSMHVFETIWISRRPQSSLE